MTPQDDPPEVDVLAKADTQPHTFLGVPFEIAIVLGCGFFVINIQFHAIFWGLVVAPFWALAFILCKYDLNGVRVFLVRFKLALILLDAHRWGSPSASPWPLAGSKGERHD